MLLLIPPSFLNSAILLEHGSSKVAFLSVSSIFSMSFERKSGHAPSLYSGQTQKSAFILFSAARVFLLVIHFSLAHILGKLCQLNFLSQQNTECVILQGISTMPKINITEFLVLDLSPSHPWMHSLTRPDFWLDDWILCHLQKCQRMRGSGVNFPLELESYHCDIVA